MVQSYYDVIFPEYTVNQIAAGFQLNVILWL